MKRPQSVVIFSNEQRFLLTKTIKGTKSLTETSIVGKTVFVSLSGRETALGSMVDIYGMSFSKESGSDSGIGLGHRVAIDHSTDVARVAGHLLTAHMVGWTCDPVLRIFAGITKNVFVHLGA